MYAFNFIQIDVQEPLMRARRKLNCIKRALLYQIFFRAKSGMKPKYAKRISQDQKESMLEDFIKNYQGYQCEMDERYAKFGRRTYMVQLQKIANKSSKTIEICLQDLECYFIKEQEQELVKSIATNTYQYTRMLEKIAVRLMPLMNISEDNPEQAMRQLFQKTLENHRYQNMQDKTNGMLAENEMLPTMMHQQFNINVVFGTNTKRKPQAVSSLKSDAIGSIVIVRAIVVRSSDVKPQIKVATFSCDVCGSQNYLQICNSNFKPMSVCSSIKCVQNRVNGKLTMLQGHSKFIANQQLKIQETPDQLKPGSIPRSFRVDLKGANVRQATPGDIVTIQGILLPARRKGIMHESDLDFDLYLEGVKIVREKQKYSEISTNDQLQQHIEKVRSSIEEEKLYNKLAASIAPEIYGLEYVKKALLLLLAGGVSQETHDHLKIRGQINIALIGDPGIAKSQLLKHISYLAPRGIYTTGKGSSGVGLTAAIVIDSSTKELCLQAGALVLADMGVCCIDQFDKMDQYDRTAIHEVMEQQTVSIAKAGITTTLNARTSILAAANPIFGRYKPSQSVHTNINLPAALLSRFDLIFLLLDKADQAKDRELAKHIGMVHKNLKAPVDSPFSPQFLRYYISKAKQFKPIISESLQSQLIQRYIKKRQYSSSDIKEGDSYVTMRSLLAVIRLCQARARLRFSNQVTRDDILECQDLILQSKKNVTTEVETWKPKIDNMSLIYTLVRDTCQYREEKWAERNEIEKRVLARGHSLQDLDITLKNYELLNVLMQQNGRVTLIL